MGIYRNHQNHQNQRQATPKMHLLMGGGQDAKERAVQIVAKESVMFSECCAYKCRLI